MQRLVTEMQKLLESLAPVFKIPHLRGTVTIEVHFDNDAGTFRIVPRFLV